MKSFSAIFYIILIANVCFATCKHFMVRFVGTNRRQMLYARSLLHLHRLYLLFVLFQANFYPFHGIWPL